MNGRQKKEDTGEADRGQLCRALSTKEKSLEFFLSAMGSRDRVWHSTAASDLCFQEITLALYSELVIGRGSCNHPGERRDWTRSVVIRMQTRGEKRGDWTNWGRINTA